MSLEKAISPQLHKTCDNEKGQQARAGCLAPASNKAVWVIQS